jgi:hypothetical protein
MLRTREVIPDAWLCVQPGEIGAPVRGEPAHASNAPQARVKWTGRDEVTDDAIAAALENASMMTRDSAVRFIELNDMPDQPSRSPKSGCRADTQRTRRRIRSEPESLRHRATPRWRSRAGGAALESRRSSRGRTTDG